MNNQVNNEVNFDTLNGYKLNRYPEWVLLWQSLPFHHRMLSIDEIQWLRC
jgi:hypothetical protein